MSSQLPPTIYAVTDDLQERQDFELALATTNAQYDVAQFIEDDATADAIHTESKKNERLEKELAEKKRAELIHQRHIADYLEGAETMLEMATKHKAEVDKLQKQIAELHKTIHGNDAQPDLARVKALAGDEGLMQRLELQSKDLEDSQALLASKNSEVDALKRELARKDDQLEAKAAECATLERKLDGRAAECATLERELDGKAQAYDALKDEVEKPNGLRAKARDYNSLRREVYEEDGLREKAEAYLDLEVEVEKEDGLRAKALAYERLSDEVDGEDGLRGKAEAYLDLEVEVEQPDGLREKAAGYDNLCREVTTLRTHATAAKHEADTFVASFEPFGGVEFVKSVVSKVIERGGLDAMDTATEKFNHAKDMNARYAKHLSVIANALAAYLVKRKQLAKGNKDGIYASIKADLEKSIDALPPLVCAIFDKEVRMRNMVKEYEEMSEANLDAIEDYKKSLEAMRKNRDFWMNRCRQIMALYWPED